MGMKFFSGQYHVNDELLKDSTKVPVSVFKSKTIRRMAADPAPVSDSFVVVYLLKISNKTRIGTKSKDYSPINESR